MRVLSADLEFQVAIAQQGVYAVYVDGNVKYVGECDNFSSRWNVGYGNISPRNCFVHGQSTNCRTNSLILTNYKAGKNLDLYFHQSENRFETEIDLIEELNPEWNIKKTRELIKNNHVKTVRTPLRNRYLPLKEYLLSSQKQVEYLTFDEMEKILKTKLPNSAYDFNAWWSNTGHQHAETWTDAGFKATSIKLGKSVTFKKD